MKNTLRTEFITCAAIISAAGSIALGGSEMGPQSTGTIVAAGDSQVDSGIERDMLFARSDASPNHIRDAIPGTRRSRAARVDVDFLLALDLGDTLGLNLFDDASYTGVVDRLDGRSFSGTIDGETGGSFVVVVNPEAIEGYVSIPGGNLYQISGNGQGELQIDHVDALRLPSCGGAEHAEAGEIQIDHDGAQQHGDASAPHSGGTADDGSRIDVLVAYTDDARSAMGGTNQMLTRIDLAIAASNRSYNNSGIGFQINLVHTVEFDYDEDTSSYGTHLTRLANKNDDYIDEVHDLRDQYGADIVTMMVDDGRYCGIARLMTSLSPNFEDDAFNIVSWFCAAGNLSFPHELGHNMGACHARGDGGGCFGGGLYNYSVGHRFGGPNERRYRTVMAYAPGSRIEYFSNPDVLVVGDPTGVANDAENALTLNQSSLVISNFRTAPATCAADFSGDGVLNFFDVSVFLGAFGAADPAADFTGDGLYNFFDVSAFLTAFNAGCP